MMRWVGVLLVYLLGSLLFVWPLPLHFSTTIWGDRFDAWTTLWLIGHLANHLRDGTLSAVTTDILYPNGYNLWSFGHAALQFIGAILVVIGIPLVPAYNALLVGGFATSGAGAHLLGHTLSGRHSGGFVAGILFCSTPYLYGEGAAGCIELVAAGLLPLHAWSLVMLLREPGRKRLLISVLTLALIGPFNWYYTLFAGIFGMGFTAWQARETGLRPAGWLLLSFVLAGLLDAPLIPLVRRETPSRPPIPPSLFTDASAWEQSNELADATLPVGALTEQLLEQHDAMQVLRNSTQLRSLATARFTVNPLKSTPGALIYLVGISLGIAGGRRTNGWLWLAAGATILTLGPFLQLDDHPPLPEWAARVPLPYYYAYTWVPFFAKAYRPYRIGVIAAMSLSAAAAAGSASLSHRFRWLIPPLWFFAFSQPLWSGDRPALRTLSDASVPSLYDHLRALPAGAVVEVPLQYQPLTVGNARFQYFQLFHQHPLLNCNQLIRRPDLLSFKEYVGKNRFLQTLMDLARTPPPYRFSGEDLQNLVKDGFRYIVVHTKVPKDAVELAGPMGAADLLGASAMKMLRESLGEPVLEDATGIVFGIPAEQVGEREWSGVENLEIPLPFSGSLALVLKGEPLVLYGGEGAEALSFWVHGSGKLGVRDGTQLRLVELDPDAWLRVELPVEGGPLQLEAPAGSWSESLPPYPDQLTTPPPGNFLKIELQRVEVRLKPAGSPDQ